VCHRGKAALWQPKYAGTGKFFVLSSSNGARGALMGDFMQTEQHYPDKDACFIHQCRSADDQDARNVVSEKDIMITAAMNMLAIEAHD
jgi:hypothetical protein